MKTYPYMIDKDSPDSWHMKSYREARKGDLDVRTDQVLLKTSEDMFEVGHYRTVHSWQTISSVDSDDEFSSLSLGRNTNRDKEISIQSSGLTTISRLE